MPPSFPHVSRTRLGYDADEVDDFLASARASFDSRGGTVTAASIRQQAFSMSRGGYATAPVDGALERLEDAFADRERDIASASGGDQAWIRSTRVLAKEIIARLDRPEGRRFDRVGLLRHGYSRREVDRFLRRVVGYFQEGTPLSIEQVRQVSFRAKRRGYSEQQVDLLLDGLIEVMLAVR